MIDKIWKIPGKLLDAVETNFIVNKYKAENRELIDSITKKITLLKDVSDSKRSELLKKMQKERASIIDTRSDTKLILQNRSLKDFQKEIKSKYK